MLESHRYYIQKFPSSDMFLALFSYRQIISKSSGMFPEVRSESTSRLNHVHSTNTQWPIFTLSIFSKKIYVITSPELVQAVFRNAKTLSFEPISTSASKRIFQMTDRQIALLNKNVHGVEEHDAVSRATSKVMAAALQPSPALFQTNALALEKFASALDEVGMDGISVDIYSWVKHHFTIATAHALYGPVNPISEDESMCQKLAYVLISPLPLGLRVDKIKDLREFHRATLHGYPTLDNLSSWPSRPSRLHSSIQAVLRQQTPPLIQRPHPRSPRNPDIRRLHNRRPSYL